MSLYETIKADMHQSLVDGDKDKRRVLSVFVGDLQSDEKRGHVVDDVYVVQKLKKSNQADAENYKVKQDPQFLYNISVLEEYIPNQMTESEIREAMNSHIEDMGGKDKVAMGSLMGYMKQSYQGRYDGKVASKVAKQLLS